MLVSGLIGLQSNLYFWTMKEQNYFCYDNWCPKLALPLLENTNDETENVNSC